MKLKLSFSIKRRVDRSRGETKKDRVAIRRRIHDGFGGDVRGGTRPVLDDDRLAKMLRQPLPHQACGDVVATTGGEPDNQAQRSGRIVLCVRDLRHRLGAAGTQKPGRGREAWSLVGSNSRSLPPRQAALASSGLGVADGFQQRNNQIQDDLLQLESEFFHH